MPAGLSVGLRCLLVGAVSAGGALALASPASASSAASPASTGGQGTVQTDVGITVTLSDTQLHWARRILAVVKMHPGLHSEDERKRAADIALMTALTESALNMYANSNNPESLRLQHDAVGSDHGSVGLFQQQVGGAINSTADWGTTAQCMDVEYSTRNFLDHLTGFDWTSYSNWDAAQKVQGSFDPTGGNYRRNDTLAIATRKMLWAATQAAGAAAAVKLPKPTTTPTSIQPQRGHGVIGTYLVQRGDSLTRIAARDPHPRVTVASLANLNRLANPDLIYVGQALLIG
jgi:nucleoid-associated protein YgaU